MSDADARVHVENIKKFLKAEIVTNSSYSYLFLQDDDKEQQQAGSWCGTTLAIHPYHCIFRRDWPKSFKIFNYTSWIQIDFPNVFAIGIILMDQRRCGLGGIQLVQTNDTDPSN
jgi:hypothetical protein